MGERPVFPLEPYWGSEDVTLYLGKCERVLPDLPPESVDAVVTDPPAAIAFMGRSWDSDLGGRDKWVGWLADCMEKAARVLKPGGHLLVWSLPRTSHWTAWALEDAGLEIRDCIVHLFGSGFPKSRDVSKDIDKANGRRFEDRYALGRHIRERREAAGLTREDVNAWFGYVAGCQNWEGQATNARVPTLADWQVLSVRLGLSGEYLGLVMREEAEREVTGVRWTRAANAIYGGGNGTNTETLDSVPATEDAARWAGWGTALKPGQEMWWLARKPLGGRTVAANVLQFGTGALNIDGVPGSRHRSRVDHAGAVRQSAERNARPARLPGRSVGMPSSEAHEVPGGGPQTWSSLTRRPVSRSGHGG